MSSDSEFSPELRAELLDDFYTECGEHFSTMREQLAALENGLANQSLDSAALETLYRTLHSLKGISAIVALRPAEQLAHAAENFLRRLTKHEAPFDAAGADVLVSVIQKLEQIVSAHRQHQPVPSPDFVIQRLAEMVETTPASVAPNTGNEPQTEPSHESNARNESPDSEPQGTIPSAVNVKTESSSAHPSRQVWRAIFTPSKALDARGVNLTAVRAELSAFGEILQATPKITQGGGMAFEFLVNFSGPDQDLARWANLGVVLERLDQPAEKVAETSPRPRGAQAEDSGAASLSIAPSHIVRVDLSRLDDLMRITGELVIQRSRLQERLTRAVGSAGDDRTGLHEVSHAFGRSLRELRQAISRVRLVSVSEIFTRMPFVVRDLAQEAGKDVRLLLEGQQTEIDKYLVERLKEPLLHLVRNAFTHGVESPAERRAAGKAAQATILLRATPEGQTIKIQIRDDGRGVDAAVVARRAQQAGLVVPEVLDDTALLDLLCTAGFSTRDEADRAAGRGVGMAVVHNTVRELGGSLRLESVRGQFTEFTLRLPLTLSIIDAFTVSAAEQICAVPQSFVQEIVPLEEGDVHVVQKREVMPYRNGMLPIVRLRQMFGLSKAPSGRTNVLVLNSERGQSGLVVDRVLGQREVVVRPIQDPLVQVPGISGATELGDGRPVLILDAEKLS